MTRPAKATKLSAFTAAHWGPPRDHVILCQGERYIRITHAQANELAKWLEFDREHHVTINTSGRSEKMFEEQER